MNKRKDGLCHTGCKKDRGRGKIEEDRVLRQREEIEEEERRKQMRERKKERKERKKGKREKEKKKRIFSFALTNSLL